MALEGGGLFVLVLAIASVLLGYWDGIENRLQRWGMPRWFSVFLGAALLASPVLVTALQQQFSEQREEERHQISEQRQEARYQKLRKGQERILGYVVPGAGSQPDATGSPSVSERPPTYKRTLESALPIGTIFLRYTPVRFRDVPAPAQQHLLDMVASGPAKNRLSVIFKITDRGPAIVLEVLDREGRSFSLTRGVQAWKEGEQHFISVRFDVHKHSFDLSIDMRTQTTIASQDLEFEAFGPTVAFGGPALSP